MEYVYIYKLYKYLYQASESYPELLDQLNGISSAEKDLENLKLNIDAFDDSYERIRSKIQRPYKDLASLTSQLDHINVASDILRNIQRFYQLKKRLDSSLQDNQRDLPLAAKTINEIGTQFNSNIRNFVK
jgi:chromosome segregation ATPase